MNRYIDDVLTDGNIVILYLYFKNPFQPLLQITTSMGSEFLLQADNYPTICKWHDAIKKTADNLVSCLLLVSLNCSCCCRSSLTFPKCYDFEMRVLFKIYAFQKLGPFHTLLTSY